MFDVVEYIYGEPTGVLRSFDCGPEAWKYIEQELVDFIDPGVSYYVVWNYAGGTGQSFDMVGDRGWDSDRGKPSP